MRVSIASIREKLVQIGLIRGLSFDEASTIADDFLDAEVRGIRAQGIGGAGYPSREIRVVDI